MTELAASGPGVHALQGRWFAEDRGVAGPASFVERLREESQRLESLAGAWHVIAHELSEHENSVHARELALREKERELDIRHDELEQRLQQLKELAAETQHANARIAEAGEREAQLRALAHDLLQRYSDTPPAG